MANITVIGSISNDFVAITEARPEIGETIEGSQFSVNFGGKGANQAVASARLGIKTNMIGAVGTDYLGGLLIDNLNENNINTENVIQIKDISSGTALITVSQGDNSIVYIPGANNLVDIDLIQDTQDMLLKSDIVVVQNEIPEKTVNFIIEYCNQNDIKVLLNPAPARLIDNLIIEKITYLTPNEIEFKVIFGNENMEKILKKHPNKLIITLGGKGVIFHDGNKVVNIPAYEVENIVDTTGAGDTFNGGFAAGISKGLSVTESIKLGNLAASLSIQKFGAQGGMPYIAKLKEQPGYEKTWNLE